MAVDADRELFLLLCRGLLETYCSQVTFDDSRFGVTSSEVPARGEGARIALDFSEAEFDRAVAVTEKSAKSLWPDRQPGRRAVQLMLVHADEEIATAQGSGEAYVLTLPDGFVAIRPSAAGSPTAQAEALEEKQRIGRILEEGREKGDTFGWR